MVENDANAAAWGEFTFGAGHDVDDLLLVTVGTGIGGGIVPRRRAVPRRLRRRRRDRPHAGGARRAAVRLRQPRLLRAVRQRQRAGPRGPGRGPGRAPLLARALLDRAGGDPDQITGPLITEAARERATRSPSSCWPRLGRWLGEGIASLTDVLDPAVVVIGGGVSEAGDLLLTPVRAAFAAQLTGRGHRPELEIRQARLGNRAGLIGAADLARR